MSDRPTTADELRRAFVDFFIERGHTRGPVGERDPGRQVVAVHDRGHGPVQERTSPARRPPPYQRATSSQKCVRAGGKHNDLDDIGRTNRHFSFFEMLGNFSFGDYFKAEAIQLALGALHATSCSSTPSRLWVTVHEDDDEAERIWRDDVGFPADRIQRLGETNWWSMGDTGSVRPVVGDLLGPRTGATAPTAVRSPTTIATSRSGISCSCSSTSSADGTRVPLPKPSIDTGAGLERNLLVVQGKTSIWDIDVFRPLIEAAERSTGARYGENERTDVSLRIIAEHARAMTFMIADGVRPSNQERGYVLRRIIRRAVLHAYMLGARDLVLPAMVDAAVDMMGAAYPEIVAQHEIVREGRRARGGGVPRHAAARRRHARRDRRRAAT